MAKMTDMPIYGKNLKIILSETKKSMTLKVGILHWVLECYQVCSNDDPGMTLTYFTARSNLVHAFVRIKRLNNVCFFFFFFFFFLKLL